MVLMILRGLFILFCGATATLYAIKAFTDPEQGVWPIMFTLIGGVGFGGLIILIDSLTPKKKLSAVSGVFLGLIVGMLATFAMSKLMGFVYVIFPEIPMELREGIIVFVGVVCVFTAITMIMQTKDDFRFVIPYVEFSKQIRGTRPMLLDTSAIIDGRILDIVDTQVAQGPMIAPKFVIDELHTISDSADKLKRARGRRGLEIVAKLQNHNMVDLTIDDTETEGQNVDQKLIVLAQQTNARLVTTDFNLAKVAELRDVDVININVLADAMRPVVLPGEPLNVKVAKAGESPGQGVGYLEDGTMVVIEQGHGVIGKQVEVVVTSVLQTSVGRMIFARLGGADDIPTADGSRTAPPKSQSSPRPRPDQHRSRNP
ncbi:MAG: PIN/TRAM domain-containing protein [Planctomycetaceae bacterium]|nr:PIN/TRAM domain-containing protein [Planctomycetaceae bacterium]